MRRLICAFVVCVWHKQVFSWRGSYFRVIRIEEFVILPVWTLHVGVIYSCVLEKPKFEPSHKTMALLVLRKLIFQTRMRSHPVGARRLIFGRILRQFPYLVSANSEGSSSEPSLVAYLISTIIPWADSFQLVPDISHSVSFRSYKKPANDPGRRRFSNAFQAETFHTTYNEVTCPWLAEKPDPVYDIVGVLGLGWAIIALWSSCYEFKRDKIFKVVFTNWQWLRM